jgi:hypothetical protein
MTGTVFKFEGTGCTATVEASYDVGWLDHLNCSGAGGWRDEIKLNDEDAAICASATYAQEHGLVYVVSVGLVPSGPGV